MPARTAADRGREVRLRLLNAAAGLIAELGWNAVSTRNLAERANPRRRCGHDAWLARCLQRKRPSIIALH